MDHPGMHREKRNESNVKTHLICILLVLVWAAFLSLSDPAGAHLPGAGQEQPSARDTTLYEVSADQLRYATEEGERVIHLDGNVRIDHQTTSVTSGRGIQYPERRYTILMENVHVMDGTLEMFSDIGRYFGDTAVLIAEGNVRVQDKGWEIFCDRARYNRENRIAVLTGSLRLADSTRVMYADTILYDRNTEVADAVGNVVLFNEVDDYSIAGRHARYSRPRKEALVDVDPILTFDLRAEEKGIITSRLMRFDVERKIGIAVGDVRMVKGETSADCDSAAIYSDEGRVELYGAPEATNGPSGMSGARMILWYNEDEVERVVIPSNGRLTEAPVKGSPWREDSWIEGDSVTIYLSEEKVDSVRIIGNSSAMYYPIEREEGKVSNNFATGDTMFFRFRDEELSYVRISGRSTGIYNTLNITPDQTIDSLAAVIDSTLKYRDFAKGAERIRYGADIIEYFADTEDIVLDGNAVLSYQDKKLEAQHIDFNSRINVLEAVGNPVLEEAGQRMYGIDVGYDMDSEAGIVVDGSTKYEEGYYRGGHIFKVGENVLKVYKSTYTTCDLKRSHYSLRSNKMKVYIKDKIVSGPITLYIGEIPVFYLPFMANSLRRDRHSGFLRPNFDIGIDSREGRFIRGLGYYWATNDYTDFLVTTDFNENQNLRLHVTNIYKIRYMLNGNVHFNFLRNLRDYTNEWTIESRHSQDFGKNTKFNSTLRFVSSDVAQTAVHRAEDVDRFVDRRIYSSANFSRSWGGTRLSLSATRNQTLNVTSLTQNRITTTMPSFSLNFPRTSFWFGEKHQKGEKGVWERALSSIMFTPNLRATRKTEESDVREKATLTASSSASFSQQRKLLFLNFRPAMSLKWDYYRVQYDRIDPTYGAATRATLTGTPIPSPSVSSPVVIDDTNNRLQITVNGETSSELSISTGTYPSGEALASELEGTINADASLWGSLVDVRFVDESDTTGHFEFASRASGSASSIVFETVATGAIYGVIGVIPDIIEQGTNYTGPTKDTNYKNEFSMTLSSGLGSTIYGIFYPNIGPLRGIRHTFNPTVTYSYTPKLSENQVMRQGFSYSIRNTIDLKVMQGGSEVKKPNVISWDLSGSYNPLLPWKRGFSTIRSNIRTGIGSLASLRISNTYDPHKKKILSTTINTDVNVNLSGSFSYPGTWKVDLGERVPAARDESEQSEESLVKGFDPSRAREKQTWSVSLGYSVLQTGMGESKRVDSKLTLRGQIQLTRGWKISYSSYYDVEAREFTEQSYSIRRDLHCWQASFIHRKFGDDWRYYFQIAIKAHPDIMYEHGTRGLQGVTGF